MKNNILDYVDFRGDLNSIDFPYNEIDYLIFSELAYVNFDNIVNFQFGTLTIQQAFELYSTQYPSFRESPTIPYINSLLLFEKMAHMPRYQNIQIISYINELDKNLVKQLSAMTLILEDQSMIVVYRGTDDSLIGWHEDFLMLCNEVVPSQTSSLHYLEFVSDYPYSPTLLQSLKNKYLGGIMDRIKKHFLYKHSRPIVLTGHSKGGNLAMYSGCFTSPNIKERITQIYNFDGPGFQPGIIESNAYLQMLPRIISYIPHYSFFGIVLGHEEKYQVIHSHYNGMIQHDAFSWEVDAHHFKEDELSFESAQFAVDVILFLEKLTEEEKLIFVHAIFTLFDNLELLTFTDLSNMSYKHILAAIKELTLLEPHIRKMLIEVLHMLWLESKKTSTN